MNVTFNPILAQLTDVSGGATAIGIWVLMAIGSIFLLAGGTNQVLGVLVKRKQLNAPSIIQQQINPQPLIVAMEKEFVHRRDYDRDHAEFKNRLTENTTYVHDRIHDFAAAITTVTEDSHRRNERLAAVETDCKTHKHQLSSIDGKIDTIRDKLGIQIGRSERK